MIDEYPWGENVTKYLKLNRQLMDRLINILCKKCKRNGKDNPLFRICDKCIFLVGLACCVFANDLS